MPEELPYPSVATTHVSVRMAHHIGALRIDVDFELTKPWTLLFGPSGSGKTTILRAVAGLLRPESGRIICTTAPDTAAAERLTLLDTAKGVFIPAHQRRIPLATQQPNLFPHMSVMENILYGPAITKEGGSLPDRKRSAHLSLNDFDLSHVAESAANELSGGEAQRVNLARALAAPSRLLLFDEPFTGMDSERRDRLLPLLQTGLAKRRVSVLSVTHDVAEAFQLGAEVIKIVDGKVVQQGPVEVVLAEERTRLLRQLSGQERSPA